MAQQGMETLTEDHLLALAKEEHEEATAELVKRYAGLMNKIVTDCCDDAQQRDDLKQEGFFGLLSAIQTYRLGDADAAFSTYAYVCIRNRVVSALRRHQRQARQESRVAISEQWVSEANDPAARVQQREQNDRLARCLQQELSTLEYGVLRLYVQDLSYEEIAARLEISPKSVDNALQRARKKLAVRIREVLS